MALRASIVIGAGSRSFRFLVKLVERMPVLAIPAWRTNRTNPVDERDVIEMLARAATADGVCGRSFDVGGPDTVSYEQLIHLIRDHMLLARPTVALGSLTLTPIASRISALIAGERHELIGPLMESLERRSARVGRQRCRRRSGFACTHSTRRSSTPCGVGGRRAVGRKVSGPLVSRSRR